MKRFHEDKTRLIQEDTVRGGWNGFDSFIWKKNFENEEQALKWLKNETN